MTDRELLQMALDALEAAYHPDTKAGEVMEAISVRLAEPPKDLELPLVRPEEFVKLIEGKENFWGIPVMRTEWPTPEPKAQFEFQNYGWWRDEEGKLQLGTQPQGE